MLSISSASLEACHARTDLAWRLSQIPEDATCRGAFFNMLDHRAGTLGTDTQDEYRRFFRLHQFASFRMYPITDYLTRLVVLSQIHYGEQNIYRGIRELQSGAFEAWAETLLGRAAVSLVEPSLGTMFRMLERAYASHTIVSRATLRVISETDREVVTELHDEYVYIEHAMVGAAEGIARMCRVRAEVTAELTGPFDGFVRVRRLA